MKLELVRKNARELLREAGVERPPIDVFHLIDHLNIRHRAAELGDDVSGVLMVKGDEVVIGYNKSHSKSRQRFTLAHEIAHYRLHRKIDELFIDKGALFMHRDGTSATGENAYEREANAFAAELLMPAFLIHTEIKDRNLHFTDERDIEVLAGVFDVSVQAMTFRLINLRVIQSGLDEPYSS